MSQLPAPSPPPVVVPTSRTNNLAIISLVAGLASFFAHIIPFVGGTAIAIVAVITGHMARRQIRQSGEQGYGLATAGMVIGYIHLAILLLILLGIIVFVIFALVFGIAFMSSHPNLPTPTPFGQSL
jgi:uncharacterized membrane protein YesL